MKVDPGTWPWGAMSALLTLAGCVWVWARGRGRVRPHTEHPGRLLLRLVLFALLWTWVLPTHGPLVTVDTARDLMEALGIARLGQHPSLGPAVPPLHASLSPLWYYLLAPTMIPASAWSLELFLIGVQVVSTEALYALVRRLAGPMAAAAAAIGLVLSANAAANFDVLTHVNLIFVVTAWALHALLRAYEHDESEQIVAAVFWLSLSLQLHATAIVLWPVAMVLAVARGRDARSMDAGAALIAALVPFLLAMPSVPGVFAEPVGELIRDVLDRSRALLPATLVVLALARPRTLTRPVARIGIGVVLVGWAAWVFPIPPGERLGLLNLGIVPGGPAMSSAPLTADVARVWLSLVRFGSPTGLVSIPVAIVLMSVGALTVARSLWRPDHARSVDRGAATWVTAWVLLTLTPGLAFATLHDAWERYVSIGALGLIVVGAIGAAELVRRAPRSRAGSVAALALTVAGLWSRTAGPVDTHPWRAELSRGLVDALIALPGMDADGLLRRVDVEPDWLDTDKSAALPFLQARAVEGTLPHGPSDGRRWWVSRTPSERPDAVRLGDTGFVAVPYTPSLRLEQATLARAVQVRDQPARDHLALPFREEDLLHYPAWVTPSLGVDVQPLIPGDDGVVVDLSLPRAPVSPAFGGLVVRANANLFEVIGPREHPCRVEAWAGDDALVAERLDEERTWFALPAGVDERPARVRVSGCSLREFHVYEAPRG